jgi:hypothetical protein
MASSLLLWVPLIGLNPKSWTPIYANFINSLLVGQPVGSAIAVQTQLA